MNDKTILKLVFFITLYCSLFIGTKYETEPVKVTSLSYNHETCRAR